MSVKRYLLATSLFIYAVLIVFIYCYYFTRPYFLIQTDLVSFLTGAKIVSDGKSDLLYNTSTQLTYQNSLVSEYGKKLLLPFRNLPMMASLYQPLLSLNLRDSFLLVFFLNTLLLLVFYLVFIHFYPELKRYKYLFFLTLLFYPSASNLIVGQYTPLILLTLLCVYLSIKSEKAFLTGFATSILAFKSQYLLFLLFSLILTKDKRRYFLGAFVGLTLFLLLNIVAARGINPILDYPKFILETESSAYGSRPYQMFTLTGVIKQFFPKISSLVAIAINLFLYTLSVLFLFKMRATKDLEAIFSVGIVLTVLFSVHALAHDLLVLLIPLFLYLASEKKGSGLIAGCIFVVSGVFSLLDNATASVVLMVILSVLILAKSIFRKGKFSVFCFPKYF